MFTVTLIRHGESLGNVDTAYYRVPDSANILTQKGVDQCVDLSKNIDNYVKDFYGVHTTVLCSKYQRAKLTAQIVMSRKNCKIIEDARLNELFHDGSGNAVETKQMMAKRMLDVLDDYPFNLICFTHGMFIGAVTNTSGAHNCEVRVYDRDQFIEMLKNV